MNNLNLASLIVGLLHIPLALTVWAMLSGRTAPGALRLWVAGSLAMGFGVIGFTLRDRVPDWISFEASYGLMTLSLLLRAAALRSDLGLPMPWRALLTLWAAVVGAYSAFVHSGLPVKGLPFGAAAFALGTFAFAHQAWRAGRQLSSRSGRVLAGFEALFGAAILLRLLMNLLGRPAFPIMAATWETALVTVTGCFAAIYASLGYLGMALDRSKAKERQVRDAELAETRRREQAESSNAQLRTLMGQRDQLLHVLAHEMRQPLHNASGALAAACEVLQHPTADSPGRATTRLRRAQAVLDHMRSVLDNTLAATALLPRDKPLVVQDVEIDLLVQLTLGDFSEDLRQRIRIQRSTELASCALEYNLVRLALRNLLRNALTHAGADAQVTLRIEQTQQPQQPQQPPALVLAVCDDGPGLAALPPAGQGGRLGLGIVRQVVALHGGRLVLTEETPRGLRAAMEFPLKAA